MESSFPDPLVPAEVDLRDFAFTPMYRGRLFGSGFNAKVSDSGWRAGVTLWLKSWDQVPAGSLPDDDVELCRLAELGRDLKSWRKLAKEALWGWFKCSDGRMHHRTVAEGVMEAWEKKRGQRDRTAAARAAAAAKLAAQKQAAESAKAATDRSTVSVTERDTEPDGDGTAPVTDTVAADVTASKGQGQGQGQGKTSLVQPYDLQARGPPPNGRADLDRIEDACRAALGDQAPLDLVIGPMSLLVQGGVPLEQITIILASEVRRKRANPIRTWAFWAKIVAERLAGAPKVEQLRPDDPGDPRHDLGGGNSALESTIIGEIDKGRWWDHWGPKWNEPGCRLPQHLIDYARRRTEAA